jgi:glycosyltransferase involved in cell wall biosynthesis
MAFKTKIVYIISNVEKALAFEWIASKLDAEKFNVAFLLIGKRETPLERYLTQNNVQVDVIKYSGKRDLAKALLTVIKFLRRYKPAIVHTHLFEANFIGLTAAWIVGVKKRIFTRHHAKVHYDEHPKGLKWDKWCNRVATHIIAISEVTKQILIRWDKVNPEKVVVVHHGFDLSYFQDVPTFRIENIKNKYGIPRDAFPVIGIISRYVRWKGIQFAIPAFVRLRDRWPNAHLILANAHGTFEQEIQLLLKELPQSAFTEIQFENDLAALYGTFDIFVHVPIDQQSEAFGQTYVEALAARVPSVFTKSGIASEFIQHRKNALVVSYQNSEEILRSLIEIADNPERFHSMVDEGSENVRARFDISLMIDQLEQIYKK